MAIEKLPQRDLQKTRDPVCTTFQQINRRSRYLLYKAVQARDQEALESLILDIEHSIHIASGNLCEILHGAETGSWSFGKYYSMATETLFRAKLEYQKLATITQN
ncbi:MAG: hypothetical protein WC756_20895 [Taibaiella sp.]|jgi:hypothetical protein